MGTFYSSPWAGRLRGCYPRSSHSSIVFCLLTSFCCLIACAFYEILTMSYDWLFFVWYMKSGTSKVYLVFLVGLLSHMYVWVVWRFWKSGRRRGAFGSDGGHIHYFQRNFILQSHYFFEIWKIRVGCCLNATNFSAYNGLCYL